ncbi:hypothetical protein KUD11_01825 [Roseovarius sp. LXJ103]|uniref:hypothetical protein n=1 Tax=Roseovarius carneus TaxID=2853164 RepID=UPI000D614620|nr:hypothetical protein [Roseovarius carneus]MBZ8117379.1 hypothetical protein [Roseovarius carneus]PWE36803.1 hypothetical protein DD563_13105 [Pelagicola sp. LXJ1103]
MKKRGGYIGGSTLIQGGSDWFGRDQIGVDPESGETAEERRKRKFIEAKREIAKKRRDAEKERKIREFERLNFSVGGPKKTECQKRKDALLRQQLLENYVRDDEERQRKKEERDARMERVAFEVRKMKPAIDPSKSTRGVVKGKK